jgi:hypothetical protein
LEIENIQQLKQRKKYMEKVITKISIKQQTSDFKYWQQQTPQKRLEALEQIRQEYHQYKYNAQPRFQKVYTIIKRELS